MTDAQEEITNTAPGIAQPVAALPEPSTLTSDGVAGNAAPADQPKASTGPDSAIPSTDPDPTPSEAFPSPELSLLQKFDKEKQAAAAEAKPEEQKPVEPAKPAELAPLAPVNYEYKLPDTIKMDDALKGDVHKAFDAFRADPAKGAQALVDLHAKTMQQYADHLAREQHRIFNETRRGWVNQVKGDPQLGGSGHLTAMGAIGRMRDQFVAEADRPAFEEFLSVTGAGDHPQFLKLMHNVSRFYDEPPLPPANPKPTPMNGMPPKRGMRSLYNQGA